MPVSAKVSTWVAFKYHWRVWKFSGYQPPRRDSIWRIPYIVFGILLNLIFGLVFAATFVINCLLAPNLSYLCEGIHVTITDVFCNLKLLNVFLMRHELLRVRTILDQLDLRSKSAEEINMLQQGIDSAKRWFLTFLRLFHFGFVTGQCAAYLSTENKLMYPAWYPWDQNSSFKNFMYAYIFQSISFLIQATQDVAVDTYPQAYMRILSAHTQALSFRIRQLGYNQRSKGVGDSVELAREQEENYEKLVECIEDHKTIIQLFVSIQKPLSSTCMAQFVSTGLSQCTIGVNLLYVGFDITIVLNMAVVFIAVSLETFILCYCGNLFCHECENLSGAIYECNWMDQSEKFKRTLLTFLQRSQKLNIIMAGNLIPVQLPTFVQVMKTAYSVFALLSTFK